MLICLFYYKVEWERGSCYDALMHCKIKIQVLCQLYILINLVCLFSCCFLTTASNNLKLDICVVKEVYYKIEQFSL